MKKITKKEIKRLERKERNRLDKEWALSIKTRDGFKCAICPSTRFLNSHHIIAREFKELRHDIDNGICLCSKHHRFSLEISPHRNPFVFMLWFVNNRNRQFINLSGKYVKIMEGK